MKKGLSRMRQSLFLGMGNGKWGNGEMGNGDLFFLN